MLVQGNIHGVKASNTNDFISRKNIPINKKLAYPSYICDYKLLNSEPYRIRLIAGGDKLEYGNDTGAPAVSLSETKE